MLFFFWSILEASPWIPVLIVCFHYLFSFYLLLCGLPALVSIVQFVVMRVFANFPRYPFECKLYVLDEFGWKFKIRSLFAGSYVERIILNTSFACVIVIFLAVSYFDFMSSIICFKFSKSFSLSELALLSSYTKSPTKVKQRVSQKSSSNSFQSVLKYSFAISKHLFGHLPCLLSTDILVQAN